MRRGLPLRLRVRRRLLRGQRIPADGRPLTLREWQALGLAERAWRDEAGTERSAAAEWAAEEMVRLVSPPRRRPAWRLLLAAIARRDE